MRTAITIEALEFIQNPFGTDVVLFDSEDDPHWRAFLRFLLAQWAMGKKNSD